MPCDYSKYPANWKTHIVPAIRARSGDRCEWCSVENRDCRDGSRIVLTVAHLDHDLAHNDGMDTGGPAMPAEKANLVHLCQRCHLGHDRGRHMAKQWRNRQEKAGQLLLDDQTRLEKSNAALRQQLENTQGAYRGARAENAELRKRIEQCPERPLSHAQAEIERLRVLVEEAWIEAWQAAVSGSLSSFRTVAWSKSEARKALDKEQGDAD